MRALNDYFLYGGKITDLSSGLETECVGVPDDGFIVGVIVGVDTANMDADIPIDIIVNGSASADAFEIPDLLSAELAIELTLATPIAVFRGDGVIAAQDAETTTGATRASFTWIIRR